MDDTTKLTGDESTASTAMANAIMSSMTTATALDTGDNGFVILSAALVFIMTPGLGYFYSGMARSKNALSLIFVCFLSKAVVILQVSFLLYLCTINSSRQ